MKKSELPNIGEPLHGGFYAGLVLVGLQTHAIIVSPKEFGTSALTWGKRGETIEATHYSDGKSNTLAMAENGSEAAQWVIGLVINDFNDWYIPSRDELEIIYRNLKPTTSDNACSFRDGENPSSPDIENRFAYTPTAPAITPPAIFQNDGAEAFSPIWHWSSTQHSAHLAWFTVFENGRQNTGLKDFSYAVRAVRRELVI